MEREPITKFIDMNLTAISRADLRNHSAPCPHCGLSVRYPTVAREQDIRDFEFLVECAYKVMDEYGITGHLLADIQSRARLELILRRDKPLEDKDEV